MAQTWAVTRRLVGYAGYKYAHIGADADDNEDNDDDDDNTGGNNDGNSDDDDDVDDGDDDSRGRPRR